MSLPSPEHFGLPAAKFPSWRAVQEQAMVRGLSSLCANLGLCLATGTGKSALNVALSNVLSNGRTAYLTTTLPLLSQVQRDFLAIGSTDIRGSGNYLCGLYEKKGSHYSAKRQENRLSCEHGPCRSGYKCACKESGCSYYDRWRLAYTSPLVPTSYAYWMHIHEYGRGLGKFSTLIFDEAHCAAEQVCSFLEVKLLCNSSIGQYIDLPGPGASLEEIQSKSGRLVLEVEQDLKEAIEVRSRDAVFLRKVLQALKSILRADDTWVLEHSPEELRLRPVWAKPFVARFLTRGVPRIILSSATLGRIDLDYLGIEDCELIDAPHPFERRRRMVYHIPTAIVRYNMSELDKRAVVSRCDQIIRARPNHRILIHTVSYERVNWLLKWSAFKDQIITHGSGKVRLAGKYVTGAEAAYRKFLSTGPPAILASPSMMTGFDFPGDALRTQILLKVPLPDSRDLVLKRRAEDDPRYKGYFALVKFMQACGRMTRSENDWGEMFVLDDSFINWFWRGNKQYAPSHFQEAFRSLGSIPDLEDFN